MDIYDYDEDNLSTVAGSCKHMKLRQQGVGGNRSERSSGSGHSGGSNMRSSESGMSGSGSRLGGSGSGIGKGSTALGSGSTGRSSGIYRRNSRSTGLSCDICAHWNGRSCAFNHFDSIYSDMCLDME